MPEKLEEIKVLVTDRPEAPADGSTLKTPAGDANVKVETMGLFKQALIRAGRTYLQVVISSLVGAGFGASVAVAATAAVELTGVMVPPQVKAFIFAFLSALGSGFGPAVVSFLMNAGEIFAKLDQSFPKWRV